MQIKKIVMSMVAMSVVSALYAPPGGGGPRGGGRSGAKPPQPNQTQQQSSSKSSSQTGQSSSGSSSSGSSQQSGSSSSGQSSAAQGKYTKEKLFEAIASGDAAALETIIKSGKVNINDKNKEGKTALDLAQNAKIADAAKKKAIVDRIIAAGGLASSALVE